MGSFKFKSRLCLRVTGRVCVCRVFIFKAPGSSPVTVALKTRPIKTQKRSINRVLLSSVVLKENVFLRLRPTPPVPGPEDGAEPPKTVPHAHRRRRAEQQQRGEETTRATRQRDRRGAGLLARPRVRLLPVPRRRRRRAVGLGVTQERPLSAAPIPLSHLSSFCRRDVVFRLQPHGRSAAAVAGPAAVGVGRS